jgi:hypothetical protein
VADEGKNWQRKERERSRVQEAKDEGGVCVGRAGAVEAKCEAEDAEESLATGSLSLSSLSLPLALSRSLSLSLSLSLVRTSANHDPDGDDGGNGDGRGRTRTDGGISRVSIAKYMYFCVHV